MTDITLAKNKIRALKETKKPGYEKSPRANNGGVISHELADPALKGRKARKKKPRAHVSNEEDDVDVSVLLKH
ncbi:hypothetical protein LTR37_017469 [Vermiconidia calcicola]|uniref:Uncharacterized protein n=1 Tax=Vermiconidia calcicola TaxID=1690605 RepID=A0ACC3MK61_9PEZI|nr:hypothetical protein LTR37_017469 [Vermiconidia calcicola]